MRYRFTVALIIALAVGLLGAASTAAVAQTGQEMYLNGPPGGVYGGCGNAGCHARNPPDDVRVNGVPRVLRIVQPGIPTDPDYRVSLLRNWSQQIFGMRDVVASFDPQTGGDMQLKAVIAYLETFVAAPPPNSPPVCTLLPSTTSPRVGTSILLTASCTGAPTSYLWTGCSSTGPTCQATSAVATTASYSVVASNTFGASSPATLTLEWSTGATGPALSVPAQVDFGAQAVGGSATPIEATVTNASNADVTITGVASDNPSEFPVAATTCSGRLGPGFTCTVTLGFRPAATGARSAHVSVAYSGGAPRQILVTGTGVASAANYTGLYWNAPAGSEDGWGMNVAHQGDIAFMTWFTYDANRKDYWLIMVGNRTADGVFSGNLVETRANPFNTVPFNPTGADPAQTVVGTATLDFAAAGGATFTYTIGGTTRTKRIVAQQLAAAPIPTCTFPATGQAAASNYTDLWWVPGGAENGWGINLTHQGDVVFGTWFTYGMDGRPMWLFAITRRGADGAYTGDVFRSTGTPYNAAAYAGFSPGSPIGTMTLTFADGARATMSYTVNGIAPAAVSQTKSLVRQTLVAPGVVCR